MMAFPSETIATFVQAVGATVTLGAVWKFLRWISPWLLPEVELTQYQRPKGAWSLVTGSSAGIGLGCARALAKRGFNVVLLGHRADELEETKGYINAEYPSVDTRTVVINAVNTTPVDIETMFQSLGDLDLSIIVNNLGGIPVAPSLYYRRLDTFSSTQTEATIALNIGFMTQLTRIAIPALASSGPSLIINVGSASHLGFPGTATYSGSKAFVLSFTRAVAREMRADGLPVDITAAVLGGVKTQANKNVPYGSPSADEFGEAMISRVGRAVKRRELAFTPWIGHAFADFVVEMMPSWLREKTLANVFRQKRRNQAKTE